MTKKNKTPEIQVGIISGRQISITLNGIFEDISGIFIPEGRWIAYCSEDKVHLKKGDQILKFESVLLIKPVKPASSSFTLHAVTIGVEFHWQRKEDQVFNGNLKLMIENNKVTAINVLNVEDYLISVISSEMNATASSEFLKAHAVISRSWLLAQLEKRDGFVKETRGIETNISTEEEIVRWYDREDHNNFDVCADDHCQRYQGITRASTPVVEQAINNTYGEVLTFAGTICDTRYYKCCGGMTELFENVWEPVNHPYIQKVVDSNVLPEGYDLNLNNEQEAKKWIEGDPDAFCNTSDRKVLSQVLNDYDQETSDFFRWKVVYTQCELSDLVKLRTGIDFGTVTELLPLERGVSGRIVRLRITGTRKSMVIGKELEIRKSLSKTHLFSSCFIVEKAGSQEEISFIIRGAGWGHGVGLCQIGAAVMGAKGYTYREILSHYFRGATLKKKY